MRLRPILGAPRVEPRIWPVALELALLVFCFAFAVYSTQSEPRQRLHPRATSPSQQTNSPDEHSPRLSAPAAHGDSVVSLL